MEKGVYPIRQDAVDVINEQCLFVATVNNEIIGSMIFRHKPEAVYSLATWQEILDDSHVLVIYTFVVNPKHLEHGIGRKMLEFAFQYATNTKMKSLRLDIYEKNIPAISLYESCDYQYNRYY